MSKQVLFLVNHYHNHSEIEEFLEQLEQVFTASAYKVAVLICDNSGGFALHKDYSIESHVVVPPKNMGYLGGCAYGFKHWLSNNEVPDFVAVSNTDLQLPASLPQLFEGLKPSIGLVSPRVEDNNGYQQNPHLLKRLDAATLARYMQIFKFPLVGALYLFLNQVKRKVQPHQKSLSPDRLGLRAVYAAHGSIFFLTRSFFDRGGKLDDWLLLYGEELYIAEQLLKLDLEAVCDTRITVIHKAHSTTRLLSLSTKSKHFYNGYKAIYERFLSPS